MINNLFIAVVALFMVIKGSTMATNYAGRLAESFRLSKYTIGFIVVAIISILPETFIAINSAIDGIPSLGLGVLLGSNVADLTLVFAIIIFLARRDMKIDSVILKKHLVYPLMLLLPIILGLNGHYSRLEGSALVLAGGIFYFLAFKNGVEERVDVPRKDGRYKNVGMLLFSMMILLVGANFTVSSVSALALYFSISPILIGMFVVGLGTTIPELFFSLKSVRKHDDALAVGDILGTVLADATIVVGIIAIINPFYFPINIIYVAGLFMVVASVVLIYFMKTGQVLSKKEAVLLFLFWILFAIVETNVIR
ncbi:MAG: hypothetical protein WCO30_01725 [bacterium]